MRTTPPKKTDAATAMLEARTWLAEHVIPHHYLTPFVSSGPTSKPRFGAVFLFPRSGRPEIGLWRTTGLWRVIDLWPALVSVSGNSSRCRSVHRCIRMSALKEADASGKPRTT